MKCKICSKSFNNLDDLLEHLKVHYPSKQCEHCSKILASHSAFTRHLTKEHPDKITRLEIHLQSAPPETDEIVCQHCGKEFETEEKLNKHIRDNCGLLRTTCDLCGKTSRSEILLRKHLIRVHTEGDLIDCEFCGESFREKAYLIQHIRRKHDSTYGRTKPAKSSETKESEKPHKCPHCALRFLHVFKLETHVREKHDATKARKNPTATAPPAADGDRKSKTNKSKVNTRELFQVEDPVYKCEFCPNTYTIRTSYTAHMRKKHNNSDTQVTIMNCPHSDKPFKNQLYFDKHVKREHRDEQTKPGEPSTDKTHKDKKKWRAPNRKFQAEDAVYFCNLCGRSYSKRNSFTAHVQRYHFKEVKIHPKRALISQEKKEFMCKWCKETLNGHDLYIEHVRSFCHEREKVYNCPCCKSAIKFENTTVNQVLEHAILCKPPGESWRYKCGVCCGYFEATTIQLHTQYELLYSNLFKDLPSDFTCVPCRIKFPTQVILDLHNKFEHPCLVTIKENWDKGPGDLTHFKMPQEKKDLQYTERTRIHNLGLQEFVFKEEIPMHKCYVCHHPFQSEFIKQAHTEICEEEYQLEDITIAAYGDRQVTSNTGPSKRGPVLKRTLSKWLHKKLVDVLSFEVIHNPFELGSEYYWYKLEQELDIYPEHIKKWLPEIIQGVPLLEKFFMQSCGDKAPTKPIVSPPSEPIVLDEIDLTEEDDCDRSYELHFECTACGKVCASAEELNTHGQHAMEYFGKRHKERLKREDEKKKREATTEPVVEKSYWNLQLWKVNGKLPGYRCLCCHRPFHSEFAKQCHPQQCEKAYELPSDEDQGDYFEDMEVDEEFALSQELAGKLTKRLRGDMGKAAVIGSVGKEEYWEKLGKDLKIPSSFIKKWLTGFTPGKRKRKAYFQDLLGNCEKNHKKLKRLEKNLN